MECLGQQQVGNWKTNTKNAWSNNSINISYELRNLKWTRPTESIPGTKCSIKEI